MKLKCSVVASVFLSGTILAANSNNIEKLAIPAKIAEHLSVVQKYMGDSDEIRWFENGFGNCEYIYVSSENLHGFYRIKPSNLYNPIALPSEIKNKMISNGRKISAQEMSGKWYFGNDKFAVVLDSSGGKDLISFSNDATLTDFCRFTERLYDEVIVGQLRAHVFPEAYRSLIELCIESHILKLNTACVMLATGISHGAPSDTLEGALAAKVRKDLIKDEMNRSQKVIQTVSCLGNPLTTVISLGVNKYHEDKFAAELDEKFLDWELVSPQAIFNCLEVTPAHFVFDEDFTWSDATKRIISGMRINQLLLSNNCDRHPARKMGEQLSLCLPNHLLDCMFDIRGNGAKDIRKSNFRMTLFRLEDCEDFSSWWMESHRSEYLTSAANLMKINRGILRATAERKYEDGFEDLAIFADRWRPVIKKHVRNYHYLFSDLPVVLSCHRAFAVARDADNFWSTDRVAIKGAAQQWMRACADGEVCRFIRSNYTADMINQYHGYIKKLLDKDEYERLATTLKISYKREDEEFPSVLK